MTEQEPAETPDDLSPRHRSYRGRLLVATPLLGAGPFFRTVVAVLDHDGGGALGVILNQPLDASVSDVLPEWSSLVASPSAVFSGGPVSSDSALAIGVMASAGVETPDGWREMYDRVGLVDLDIPAAGTHVGLRGVRVFAGYAGWSPGQLEEEIEEGSWVVVDGFAEDLLSPNPEALWRDVLRRQGGDLAMLSTFPDDPHMN
ncbi:MULTISPECIES: YqgE/AlgH family protein [Mumia]|uniref:YqgE/AlgH family protein n=1 Tax=Mumia TaxID=1546255 RepID=UPI001421AC92|nr:MULTISPECIES: YqgE/AlgH family protein [unclassified Mumia]QMW65510.1 YqgE/AlgH family protein [Mumia sp. ZJ1417]